MDLCADKTTYAHNGYGEAKAGLVTGIVGKPGGTRGGQIVLLADANANHVCTYIHCHKLHILPPDWKRKGPAEIQKCLENMAPMVEGEPGNCKKVFREKPHVTADNFFLADEIFN